MARIISAPIALRDQTETLLHQQGEACIPVVRALKPE